MFDLTNSQSEKLLELGYYLKEVRYKFTTVTPNTHRNVLENGEISSDPLRRLLGWNQSVNKNDLPVAVIETLRECQLLELDTHQVKCSIRASTIKDLLLFHSPFPTHQANSVFFGPDSYRFVQFLENHLRPTDSLLDLGCGTGVGGLFARSKAEKVTLSDINTAALALSSINAKLNRLDGIQIIPSDMFANIPTGISTVISNPPFIIDSEKRSYRDGGENYGTDISVEIIGRSLDYLTPGGELYLYTGTCFVDGKDILFERIQAMIQQDNVEFNYFEIDPDIFGEELCHPQYSKVERIAAVGLKLRLI